MFEIYSACKPNFFGVSLVHHDNLDPLLPISGKIIKKKYILTLVSNCWTNVSWQIYLG
jgi:hypothetical protein